MTGDKSGVLQFIGVACLIFCVLFVVFSLPFFWKQVRVLRSWPITQAQVLRSEVVMQGAPDHGQFYTAELHLSYTVDGMPITAELIGYQSKNYQDTERHAGEFPVGSLHEIRYDPHDPSQSRIGAGWNSRFFAVPLLLLGMGAVFAIIGGMLFLATR
jgi:hypothetical protein